MQKILKVDVSLTSHGNRIYFLPIVLFSITRLNNTLWERIYIHIDQEEDLSIWKKLILWLTKTLFPVQILFGKSKGPHSKYYSYLFQVFRNKPFVLIDDDMFYSKRKLKKLITHGQLSKFNTSLRCVKAKFHNNNFLPYNTWKPILDKEKSLNVFATNVGGTYVTPEFAKAVKKNFESHQYFPFADDVFFYFIALKEKMPYSTTGCFYEPKLIPLTQINALWKTNVNEGRNDEQILNITKLTNLPEYDFE